MRDVVSEFKNLVMKVVRLPIHVIPQVCVFARCFVPGMEILRRANVIAYHARIGVRDSGHAMRDVLTERLVDKARGLLRSVSLNVSKQWMLRVEIGHNNLDD